MDQFDGSVANYMNAEQFASFAMKEQF